MTIRTGIVSLTMSALVASSALAQSHLAKASAGQQVQDQTMSDVPHCARKLGTMSIVDGDDPSGWTQYSLAPPQKLLKVLVARSGCFNLVDRGSGLQAAEKERDIGSGLGLQRRSNVGQGQIKAADYVLVAEVAGANSNVSGSGVAGGIGAVMGGPFGGLIGGLHSRKQEANVVLSITNVRTTETIATEDGYAAKSSVSFGGGGGIFGGGVGAGAIGGGYDNTDIGRIVTLAFIQSYAKIVNDMGGITPGDPGTAQAAPKKTFTAQAPTAMHRTPAAAGAIIRTLPPGAIVYPTGNQNGLWWEVADENDNVGWVINTKLAPSQ